MKIIREISHPLECLVSEGGQNPSRKAVTVPDRALGVKVSHPSSSGFTAILLFATLFLLRARVNIANRHEKLWDPREPRQMFCIKRHKDFAESPQRRLVFFSFLLFSVSPSYCNNESHIHLNTHCSTTVSQKAVTHYL